METTKSRRDRLSIGHLLETKFESAGGATRADGVETRPAGALFPAGNESDHIGLNARSSSTSISIGSPFLSACAIRSVASCTVLARSAIDAERARKPDEIDLGIDELHADIVVGLLGKPAHGVQALLEDAVARCC